MLSRKSSFIFFILICFSLFEFTNYIVTPSQPPAPEDTATIPSPTPAPVLGVATKTMDCHALHELPDPACTPGATDPRVTQGNLFETICKKGYTLTVRPPVTYTNKLKTTQIIAYGYVDPDPRHYEEDHLIPLELGGAPFDSANLWPEFGAIPNPKDSIENLCNQKVCDHQISLSDAQLQIATDWHNACR